MWLYHLQTIDHKIMCLCGSIIYRKSLRIASEGQERMLKQKRKNLTPVVSARFCMGNAGLHVMGVIHGSMVNV